MIVPEQKISLSKADLRPPKLDDAQSIFRNYSSDPEVTKYLIWPRHTAISQTKEFLATCPQGWASGKDFTWAICPKGSTECVGMIGLRMPEGAASREADFGYVLSKSYWGRGIVTEALAHLADWTLSQPAVVRVWAECHVDNAASARVLEKAGFQRESRLRKHAVFPNLTSDAETISQPQDCFICARVE